ncbi:hypothetical protein P389DRAFT_142731 [Cystobasidium minutum MCA 4210]|uniref:uncharacterized protein n=1 Tax=Cystobasidium minutum MCA 4210 TaxID=1397322 RepID=UPI0034CD97A9|eukprot:jgi/Rhomi1/142731/e_gw1.3.135.1
MQIFGTDPVGTIGVHKPREIIRLDRDYTSGEICQFWSGFPIELEGRITATQHLNVMNELNAILASAFDPYKAIFDNVVAVLSLYISTWLLSSHYDKEIARFDRALEGANRTLYNPAGLNMINPKKNGYLFVSYQFQGRIRFQGQLN